VNERTAREVLEGNSEAAEVYVKLRDRYDSVLPAHWYFDLDKLIELIARPRGIEHEGWDGHDMNALEAILRGHYLAQIECDHEGKRDRAQCQCSLVSLGWHPSVGDAVQSWVDHVMALIRGRWSADSLIRRAGADHG
jgi:hypothetical protein